MSITAYHGNVNDCIFLLIFNPALVRNCDLRLSAPRTISSHLAAGADLHGCR